MVYSTRRFVLCLTLCHFVLVFSSPFSIAITSLWEERANLSAFRTFVRFVLVWICRFPLPLGVMEGLRFVIVALPGLFSYFFYPGLRSVRDFAQIKLIFHPTSSTISPHLPTPHPSTHTHTHTHTHTRAHTHTHTHTHRVGFLLTVQKRVHRCSSYLRVRLWFHVRSLFCHYFSLMSSSLVPRKVCAS